MRISCSRGKLPDSPECFKCDKPSYASCDYIPANAEDPEDFPYCHNSFCFKHGLRVSSEIDMCDDHKKYGR